MLYPLLTRGGKIKLVHQWTRNFSTMSAKPDKTSSNMLSSHILYWIVGSVCLEEPLRDRLFLCAGGWVTVMTQPYWALWYEQQPLQLLWLDPQLQVREEEREGRAEEEEVLASTGTMMVRPVNIGSDTGHCVIDVMSEWCLSFHSKVTNHRPRQATPSQARPVQARLCTVGPRNRLNVGKRQSVVIQCYSTLRQL